MATIAETAEGLKVGVGGASIKRRYFDGFAANCAKIIVPLPLAPPALCKYDDFLNRNIFLMFYGHFKINAC